MILKLGPFKKSKKREVKGFRGWTKVQLRLDHDNVIIN